VPGIPSTRFTTTTKVVLCDRPPRRVACAGGVLLEATITVAAMRPIVYCSPYRTDEARFDAAIEDWTLRELGVIEDDQPTEYSHDVYMRDYVERAAGDFTPEERQAIRAHLGLGPFEVSA
jgi:hypothetical protein